MYSIFWVNHNEADTTMKQKPQRPHESLDPRWLLGKSLSITRKACYFWCWRVEADNVQRTAPMQAAAIL